jgi:hypothetical protein
VITVELKSVRLATYAQNLSGLAEMVSLSARKLKTLQFMGLNPSGGSMLAGLCEELEALAGYNNLQHLNLIITVDGCESRDLVNTGFGRLQEILLKTGWSTLKGVSLEVVTRCCYRQAKKLNLESLAERYLSRLLSWGILDYKVRPI